MDEELLDIARHHAYGSLGLDADPELAFAGVRALRELADFCEGYQVRRLREAGHSWARIAAWTGVSPQAVHKKYARAIETAKEPSTQLSSGDHSHGPGGAMRWPCTPSPLQQPKPRSARGYRSDLRTLA